MIDTMEIERVMDVLLEKVERNSQVNQLKELLLRSSEERKEVGIELQKMMTRVSILPSRYQKRIFQTALKLSLRKKRYLSLKSRKRSHCLNQNHMIVAENRITNRNQ